MSSPSGQPASATTSPHGKLFPVPLTSGRLPAFSNSPPEDMNLFPTNPLPGASSSGAPPSVPLSVGSAHGAHAGFETAPLPQGQGHPAPQRHPPVPQPHSQGLNVNAVACYSVQAMPLTTNSRGWISGESLEVRDPLFYQLIFPRALLFHPSVVNDDELIGFFMDNGLLPGGLHVKMVRSPDWQARIAVDPHLLYRSRMQSLDDARAEMVLLAYQRVTRAQNEHLVLASYCLTRRPPAPTVRFHMGAALVSFPKQEFHCSQLRIPSSILLCSVPS